MKGRAYNPEALEKIEWCTTLAEKEGRLIHNEIRFESYTDLHTNILSLIECQEYLTMAYEYAGADRYKSQIVENISTISVLTTKLFASLASECEFLDSLLVVKK